MRRGPLSLAITRRAASARAQSIFWVVASGGAPSAWSVVIAYPSRCAATPRAKRLHSSQALRRSSSGRRGRLTFAMVAYCLSGRCTHRLSLRRLFQERVLQSQSDDLLGVRCRVTAVGGQARRADPDPVPSVPMAFAIHFPRVDLLMSRSRSTSARDFSRSTTIATASAVESGVNKLRGAGHSTWSCGAVSLYGSCCLLKSRHPSPLIDFSWSSKVPRNLTVAKSIGFEVLLLALQTTLDVSNIASVSRMPCLTHVRFPYQHRRLPDY